MTIAKQNGDIVSSYGLIDFIVTT